MAACSTQTLVVWTSEFEPHALVIQNTTGRDP